MIGAIGTVLGGGKTGSLMSILATAGYDEKAISSLANDMAMKEAYRHADTKIGIP